jgi:hypothetical protein
MGDGDVSRDWQQFCGDVVFGIGAVESTDRSSVVEPPRLIDINEYIRVPVEVTVCPECGGTLICHLPRARFAMGVPAGMCVDCEVALRGTPDFGHSYGSPGSGLYRAWSSAASAVSAWARQNLRVRHHDTAVVLRESSDV